MPVPAVELGPSGFGLPTAGGSGSPPPSPPPPFAFGAAAVHRFDPRRGASAERPAFDGVDRRAGFRAASAQRTVFPAPARFAAVVGPVGGFRRGRQTAVFGGRGLAVDATDEFQSVIRGAFHRKARVFQRLHAVRLFPEGAADVNLAFAELLVIDDHGHALVRFTRFPARDQRGVRVGDVRCRRARRRQRGEDRYEHSEQREPPALGGDAVVGHVCRSCGSGRRTRIPLVLRESARPPVTRDGQLLTTGYSGSGSSSRISFPSLLFARLSGPAIRSSPTPLRASPGIPPGSPRS